MSFSTVGVSQTQQTTDSLPVVSAKASRQKDLEDVVRHILKPGSAPKKDDETKDTQKHISIIPAAGYTLQTGFAALVSGNMAFYSDTAADTKLSNISSSITYSQYKQIIIPLQINLWTKGDHFNFITDFRYINYPSDIYGLGNSFDPNKGYEINYKAIKLHQTFMKAVGHNFYAGAGFYFDHFYNISSVDTADKNISNQINAKLGTSETASGIALRFLYDSRLNQINANKGNYFNVTYRTSQKFLGSDNNWQSVQLDARTYHTFPKNSKNVLAFWMFNWLTLSGTPPYLLLPSTGWDDNYNTGRGYIQSRFRGKDMLYFETEYRFGITQNGLLGGVAFANVEHFSADLSAQYNGLIPGYGLGVRLKLNKYSKTNLAVDYGFGQKGSRGFFVNLGEVF